MVIDAHIHIQPREQFRPEAFALMTAGRNDTDLIHSLCESPDNLLRHLDGEVEVVNGRLVPNPMEPLAILAVPARDQLTVFVSHQRPHELRDDLASQLELDPGELRVIVPDVGGAFGF